MLATLIIYFVVNGHMQVVRIPQTDMATCQAAAPDLSARLKAIHAECKVKKPRKSEATS